MDSLLAFALDRATVPPDVDSLSAWWSATGSRRAVWREPIDRAIAGGVLADRLGFAFAGGYAEALRALVPDAPEGITALCATEEAGAHPRAIRTTLTQVAGGYKLSGHKRWATIASASSSLLVVASIGVDAGGRNQLRVVRVRTDAPGVRLRATSAPFIPEIPHAEVELDAVAVAEIDVLPGDGYDRYLKPFRTIEDAHVHAALAGYLIGVARRHGFPHETIEQLAALAVATRAVASADPAAAATHLALAGVLASAAHLVGDIERRWAAAPDDELARWQRDRGLLRVASSARMARRERAWAIFDREPGRGD